LKHPRSRAVWFSSMSITVRTAFAIFLLAPALSPAAPLSYVKDIRPVLETYCWDCHADGAKKGDVVLDTDKDEAAIARNRKLWTGAMFHIEQWTMPP
jgi:hypothetical protein